MKDEVHWPSMNYSMQEIRKKQCLSDTDFSYSEKAMPFEKGEQQHKPGEMEESCRAKAKKKLSDTSRHHLVLLLYIAAPLYTECLTKPTMPPHSLAFQMHNKCI